MKRIYIIIMVSIAFAAVGCVSETLPQGSVQTQEQVAESESALKAMANAIPASMMTSDVLGWVGSYGDHTDFGIAGIHLRTDFMLEDLVTSGDNPYYNRFYAYVMNRSQGERYISCAYFWQCYYKWIKAANDIISLVNPVDATPEALGYLAAAYTYRAMFYLDLARLYEPKENAYTDVTPVLGLTVPLVTEATTEEQAKNNPRVPREGMYEFILSDLAEAERLMSPLQMNYTLPSLASVYGLYARAWLEMGYWNDADSQMAFSKAAEYARKAIVQSGKIPLTLAQWEDPVNGFNNGAASDSWIWGLTTSSENTINIITFTAHISSEATWGYAPLSQICASKRFYDAITEGDFRKNSWLDPLYLENPDAGLPYSYKFSGTDADKVNFLRGTEMNPPAVPYQNIKFRPYLGECSDYAVGNCADHPLMRVEEMYFIEMEAVAHSDLSLAKILLEEFMDTRVVDGSFVCEASDLNSFLDEMLFQKRVEFWGEGVVFFDYKRLGKGIQRGYPGTNEAAVYAFNSDGLSPQWNIVVTNGEFQYNAGINSLTNNPDPSGKLVLWNGE